MTDEDLKKFASAQVNKMSPQMRAAISEFDWVKELEDISSAYSLSLIEVDKLKTEVSLVFLGATHPLDFLDALIESFGWGRDKVLPLYQDVNNKVFTKIYELAKSKGLEIKEPTLTPEQQKIKGLLERADEELPPYEDILLAERLKIMPKPVQNLLLNPKFVQTIKNIGDKFSLNEQELSTIENIVTLEILSDRKVDNILSELKKSIRRDEAVLGQIAELINSMIIKPTEEEIAVVDEIRVGLKSEQNIAGIISKAIKS